MKHMEADVVVIALGLSGLAAAIAAAEQGLSVIGFEKGNTTGGAANMGMGPFAVESRPQKEAQVPLTREEAYKMHMEFSHYKADARLVHDYYWKSADTIDWLMDMGVRFEVSRYFPSAMQTAHNVLPIGGGRPGPRGASTMIRFMTERAKELGVQMFLSCPAYKILMENGRPVGVLAKEDSGEEIEARCSAVIIATGGMGSNTKMLKDEFDLDMGAVTFAPVQGSVGDGLRMAWEAGAAKSNITFDISVATVDNLDHFILEGAFRAKPELMVNVDGERFINEEVSESVKFVANAIMMQKNQCAYVIFDQNRLNRLKKYGPEVLDQVHGADMFEHFDEAAAEAIATGYREFCKADSLEELADHYGIDKEALCRTVEEYNHACDTGRDNLLCKSAKYLNPVRKPPFYAMRMVPQTIGPLGGIKVNYRLEVLDKDHNKIPGLYAVGTDAAGDAYGPDYPLLLTGNTMAFCLNTGRIAAENAAEWLNEKFFSGEN